MPDNALVVLERFGRRPGRAPGPRGIKRLMAFDPRSIANLLLDEADRSGYRLTNLALQKLLYFAHAIFLIEQKRPLVSGYFEAWEYGPVHPTAYQAFRQAGAEPIEFRAERVDAATGARSEIVRPEDLPVRQHITRIVQSYGRMTPGRLVEISHAKGAPWDFIANKGRTSLAFGMRISDDVIRERFKHHKVSVGHFPIIGEPGEDTPLV
jgi:uncharacterized phage-associated protein